MSESEKNILDAFFESKTRTKILPKVESLSTPKPVSKPAEKKKDVGSDGGGGWAEFERKAAPTSSLKVVPLVKNLREVKGSDAIAEDNLGDGTEAPLDTQKKTVWNPNKSEKGPQVSKKLFPTLQDSLTITTTERAKPKDKEKEKEKEKEKPKEKVLPKFVAPAPQDFKQKNIYDEILEETPHEEVATQESSKTKTEKKKKGKEDEKKTTKAEPTSEITPSENQDTTSTETYTNTNEESEKSTKSKKKKKGKTQSTNEPTPVENQETTNVDTNTPTDTPSIDSTTTEKGTQKKGGKKQEKKPVQDEVDKLMQEMGLADEKKKSTKKKGK